MLPIKKKLSELPEYAVHYFDHLLAELDNLLTYSPDNKDIINKDDFTQKAEQLRQKRAEYNKNEQLHLREGKKKEIHAEFYPSKEKLTWKDLYEIELLISNILPLSRLSRQVWQLRLRYRDVVGLAQYEAYLASKPPELATDKVTANDYKADIDYLLTEIYVRYMITPYNEDLRNRISGRVTVIILIGITIVAASAASFNYFHTDSLGPINLLLVLFIGAMGGLCSMQQRYQSTPRDGDPVDNVLVLQQGWSRLFMPAISGSIFAALLYFIIIGGLVQGELFPFIPSKTGTDYILEAIRTNHPATVADYAKLVIWSFLAGFAERLVPDTLTRFTSTKEIGSKIGK